MIPNKIQPLKIKAPLMGWALPLEEIPDQVFAQKMMGDGISIDPIDQVLKAPIAGQIVQLHPSHHALTIRSENGLEILIHIGIDTVNLKGEGFRPRVKVGDLVQVGDTLIEFDADFIATRAKSLLTQVVIIEPKTGLHVKPFLGAKESIQDTIMELSGSIQSPALSTERIDSDKFEQARVSIVNPSGIHARPAAMLVHAAKNFNAVIRLKKGDQEIDGRSLVGILGLEVAQGDDVQILTSGQDAAAALAELKRILSLTFDEEHSESATSRPEQRSPSLDQENQFHGVSASRGIALGQIFPYQLENLEFPSQGEGYDHEKVKFENALSHAKGEIAAIKKEMALKTDAHHGAIFEAHIELLDDPTLFNATDMKMKEGYSASYSWQKTYQHQVEILRQANNELIRGRASDLQDVGRRVLKILTGSSSERPNIPKGSIVIAEDLTPSDMSLFELDRVVGFCTVAGGSTSHVAILARSLGLPAASGLSEKVLHLAQNTPAIIDGTKGVLTLNPSSEQITSTKTQMNLDHIKSQEDLKHALEKAMTHDGREIKVLANINAAEDAFQAVKMGAQGVGLLRSEFLFMEGERPPSIVEQRQVYENMMNILGPDRIMTIRTLDIGGDKPVSYLDLGSEANPFLGIRGVRLGFDYPEMLREQIQAILQASQGGKLKIMFPMITFVDEVRFLKEMVREEQEKLGLPPIPIGIMVEVPSAALMADQFAEEVDFFSIGTNDLTQYTLAMDRTHPKLAKQVDGLDPSVLALIHRTAQAAIERKKSVSVCGGLASESIAIPILIGLGIQELSVSISSIPSIKADIRRLSFKDCRELAMQCLKLTNAAAVRQKVQSFIDANASQKSSQGV